MLTSNGQLVCTEDNLVQTPYGLLITEVKKGESLSPSQMRILDDISYALDESERLKRVNAPEKEFVEHLKFHGIKEFIDSLKMIHDFALYHTDLCFDTVEKNALFNLKILRESLEQMEKEL